MTRTSVQRLQFRLQCSETENNLVVHFRGSTTSTDSVFNLPSVVSKFHNFAVFLTI
jgi:hypothetical protein